jgi:hypothetical protein
MVDPVVPIVGRGGRLIFDVLRRLQVDDPFIMRLVDSRFDRAARR